MTALSVGMHFSIPGVDLKNAHCRFLNYAGSVGFMRRIFIFSLFYGLLLQPLYAQQNLVLADDTVRLGEVLIVPSLPEGAKAYKVSYIDGDILRFSLSGSIAEALAFNTPLYIKSYGSGGAATSSFRGMGANHTQIVWEGMRIDNPMTGQTDLSTLMTAFADDITIYNGGTPVGFGNRGPGGTVSVQSNTDWQNKFSAEYTQNIGSFSNLMEKIDIDAGKHNISYRLRAYLQNNDNDYEYTDPLGSDYQVLKREGAAYSSRGMLHELDYKKNNTIYGARLWYNLSERDLPGSIAYEAIPGNENQVDESVRTIVSFQNYFAKIVIKGQLGYLYDWMHYNNKLYLIDSRNHVSAVNARLSGVYKFSENTSLKLGFDYRLTDVNTNNYADPIQRKKTAFETAFSHLIGKKLGLIASLNQEIMNGEFLRISPSAGFDYSLFNRGDYHIKGSLGLSNHLPTLNDLYWSPGGNSDLKTEMASNYEITFSFKDSLFKIFSIDGSITAYKSLIEDMILWVPESEFVWIPQNIAKVLSNGIEIDQQLTYTSGNHMIKFAGSYYYTNVSRRNALGVEDNAVGKQLIYVPSDMASFSSVYGYSKLLLIWRSSYTGKRYITEDNSDSLPAYWLSSASIENTFTLRSSLIAIRFKIDNIFGKDYQSVKDYPMPWRSYMFSLTYKFSSK